ncbi:MAG: hypothetical protein K0Q87_4939 [Neobacillus sp.]|nr:hypothetical protein [Neobacillus sp.]
MMTETFNYQSIIDTIALLLSLAVPISIAFGVTVKLVRFMLSMVLGDRKVDI